MVPQERKPVEFGQPGSYELARRIRRNKRANVYRLNSTCLVSHVTEGENFISRVRGRCERLREGSALRANFARAEVPLFSAQKSGPLKAMILELFWLISWRVCDRLLPDWIKPAACSAAGKELASVHAMSGSTKP